MARALAPRDHRSRHSADSLLALSQPIDLKRIDNEKRQLPTLMMAISRVRFGRTQGRSEPPQRNDPTRGLQILLARVSADITGKFLHFAITLLEEKKRIHSRLTDRIRQIHTQTRSNPFLPRTSCRDF